MATGEKKFKDEKKRLITILKEDHNFDVIKEMVDLYHKVVRSRMIKAAKYKLQFQLLSKIMEYALPKLRVEEHKNETGDQITFNILVGQNDPSTKALPGNKPKQIDIPTKVDPDGNFVIDLDKQG